MSEEFLIRSAVIHLAVALRLLDRAGAAIPAAEVDAVLNNLGERLRAAGAPPDDSQDIDLSALDSLVNELYGKDKRAGKNGSGVVESQE